MLILKTRVSNLEQGSVTLCAPSGPWENMVPPRKGLESGSRSADGSRCCLSNTVKGPGSLFLPYFPLAVSLFSSIQIINHIVPTVTWQALSLVRQQTPR